jgi:uncharacterized protein (DUF302 family)
MTPAGLKIYASAHGSKDTIQKVLTAITDRGFSDVTQIDHATAAKIAGLTLRPTEVFIFGNAKSGAPLMQSAPSVGIDLPLKILVWEDETAETWLAYSDPNWIAQRHGITCEADHILRAMTEVLDEIAAEATRA